MAEDTQFSKSIILKDFNIWKDIEKIPVPQGLGVAHKQTDNDETYQILQGTKIQINKYLQDCGKNLLSERSRHFANLPKVRNIGGVMVRVQ